ncbi:hypothetical protein VSK93_19695 [Clostridioides difficile]|uniref:hypothetical protein n=1 Tax=Clostridioides difficile TaxID=1496 RepID=UPI00308021BE
MKNKVNKFLGIISVALVGILMFNISTYVYASSSMDDIYSNPTIFDMYKTSENIENTPLENLEVKESEFLKLQSQIHENYPFVNIDKSTIHKKSTSTNTNEIYYSISYSLTGENVEKNSNVNFIYNKDCKLLSSQYSVAIDTGNGNIKANIYIDNLKMFEITTEKNQKTNQDYVTSVIKFSENGKQENITASVIGAKSFFSCFNNCLSRQGVAGWVVAALGVACGFVCASTAGTGCIPCLYASGLVVDGTIAYCVGTCL